MAQIGRLTVHLEAGASVRLLNRALELIERIDDPAAGQVKTLLLEMAQEAIIVRPDDTDEFLQTAEQLLASAKHETAPGDH